ncbi:MAG: hypothetical protein U9N55_07520 [candidate division Zixibacteria bacterium]|nr:hypothetical protein [candidate division Zixibacteria bacterium]
MNRRVLAYIGAAIGLVAIWFFMIYAPYRQERKQELTKTEQALNQLANFDQILSSVPNYLSSSANLEADKMNIMSHLYVKSDILKLFGNLERTAKQHNLMPLEIRPSILELLQLNTLITTTNKQPLFINIDMNLTGDYVDIGRFVQSLESKPFFRGLSHCLILENTDASNGDLRLNVRFKTILAQSGAKS